MVKVRWWREPSAEALSKALLPPTVICAEYEGIKITGLGMPPQDVTQDATLILSVTTLAAYQLPVARIFISALDRRLALPPDLRQRVETALQEALANAVVHGNLAISSSGWGDFDFFRRLEQAIERRLANRTLAYRRIALRAWWTEHVVSVSVRDQGRGPPPDPSRPRHPKQGAINIDGLAILRAVSDRVAVDEGGRLVCMDFAL